MTAAEDVPFGLMEDQSSGSGGIEGSEERLAYFTLGDRQLNVNIARPREERSPGGFRNNFQSGRKQSNRGGSRRY